jgi:hypothetical protein
MMKVAAVSFEPPKSVASSSGIAVASSITELIPASFILRAVVGPIPSISPLTNSATFHDVCATIYYFFEQLYKGWCTGGGGALEHSLLSIGDNTLCQNSSAS